MTFKAKVLVDIYGEKNVLSGTRWDQPPPIPDHLVPGMRARGGGGGDEEKRSKRFEAEMERISPWGMKDLTIGSWVKLARSLVERKKMWKKFEEIMWVFGFWVVVIGVLADIGWWLGLYRVMRGCDGLCGV